MKKKIFISVCLLIVINVSIFSQSNAVDAGYFRSPLNIPLQLASNFGEVRTNHFHMGIDIRTQSRENLPVFAIADGYVSRISVQEYGFGRAIYITHPNGYTSLYAHLNLFYPALEAYLKTKQYSGENWQQDINVSPEQFRINKGQLIAYSGNTGASQGPHLHFEIRDTKTGNNLNPLFFGFDIKDDIAPAVYGLYWYDRRYSTYMLPPHTIPLTYKNKMYSDARVTEVGSPLISLGIKSEDKNNASPFRFGIYSAALFMDDSLLLSFKLDKISYDSTRYVNACIDYTSWVKQKSVIQHLSVLPGNYLSIFDHSILNGVIILTDTLVHNCRIIVSDVSGNKNEVSIKLRYNPALEKSYEYPANSIPCVPDRENLLQSENAQIKFSKYAFYDVAPFKITEQNSADPLQVSSSVTLNNHFVPVHDYYEVMIKSTLTQYDPLRNYTIMQLTSGSYESIVKGEWQGTAMRGNFNRLGTVRLLVDTIPPEIKPSGWYDKAAIKSSGLTLRCTDNMDEINFFRAELDGKWLMFSKKGSFYFFKFDEHCLPGTHTLVVAVSDVAGNKVKKTYTFTR